MKKRSFKSIALLLLLCNLLSPTKVANAASVQPSTSPVVTSTYSVMNQVATINLDITSKNNIKSLVYAQGEIESVDAPDWDIIGIDITGDTSFEVIESGIYSILAKDSKGNASISYVNVDLEFRAVWISYLEFSSTGYASEEVFRKKVDEMFDNVASMNMNAVVVQVRPFSDAMYKSYYFPWSKYVSGTQGKAPSFDPMEVMIEEAHEKGLEFHAWINPYRITTNSTDVKALASNHPARKWLTDSNKANDRNVLIYGGNLYYNPASTAAQGLIVKGVKEIVQKYDVDGIHFDDYFYPSLGNNYATVFDAKEYEAYKKSAKAKGQTVLSIADWRRNNVNTLVKNVYTVINKVDPDVEFGISPAGYYDKLMMDDRYYVDVNTWLSKDGYVDYICPQLYWSFEHKTYPYMDALEKWLSLRTNSSVKMYVGIPVYKTGSNEDADFKKNTAILKEMVECGRDSEMVDGFMFFRYAFFNNKTTSKAVTILLDYLSENPM